MTTISLHFEVEADYIVNLARQAYHFEDNETWAKELLRSFIGISEDSIDKIINGNATITGWNICENKECDQCKGKTMSHYEEIEDKKFKAEIISRRLWLNEDHIKVGEFHIHKDIVSNLVEAIAIKNKTENYDYEYDHVYADIQKRKDAFWNTNAYKKPSEDYIPKEKSRDYAFTMAMSQFIKEIEFNSKDIVNPKWIDEITEPLFKKYAVIKEPLQSKFNPKPQRIEGCMLIGISDPSDNDTMKYFNLKKEMFILYVKERMSHYHHVDFLMNLDTDKEKVKKALVIAEKKVGYAHKAMMHSMNLRHSETGYYDADMIEHYVNGLLQWYMYRIIFHSDNKILEKLPNELTLDKREDAYEEGILIGEKIDLK